MITRETAETKMSLELDVFQLQCDCSREPSLSCSKRAGSLQSSLLQGGTSLFHVHKATALYQGLRKQCHSAMIHHSSRVCALNAECIQMNLSHHVF